MSDDDRLALTHTAERVRSLVWEGLLPTSIPRDEIRQYANDAAGILQQQLASLEGART